MELVSWTTIVVHSRGDEKAGMERDHNATLVAQKVPLSYYDLTDDDSLSYTKHLTPHAYQFLEKQMELMKLQSQEDGMFESMSNILKLPCHHNLKARYKLWMGMYDEALCDKHWSTAYYKLNQQILQMNIMNNLSIMLKLFSLHQERRWCPRYT